MGFFFCSNFFANRVILKLILSKFCKQLNSVCVITMCKSLEFDFVKTMSFCFDCKSNFCRIVNLRLRLQKYLVLKSRARTYACWIVISLIDGNEVVTLKFLFFSCNNRFNVAFIVNRHYFYSIPDSGKQACLQNLL